MLFTSFEFVAFLACVLVLYYLIPVQVSVDFTACCKCIFLRTFRALRAAVYGSYDCDLICRRPYHVCGAVPHG